MSSLRVLNAASRVLRVEKPPLAGRNSWCFAVAQLLLLVVLAGCDDVVIYPLNEHVPPDGGADAAAAPSDAGSDGGVEPDAGAR